MFLDSSKKNPNRGLTRCTCGKNSKCEQAEVDHCVRNESSRCPCAVNGNVCCRECKCKGCQTKEEITTVQSTSNVISCSCGKGKKKCRCLKNGWKCTSACECYNCHNQTTELPVRTENDETKSGKRKRVNPSQYKRVKSKEYLENEMGHEPLQGSWTHLETFVLVSILSLLSTLPLSPSINDIAKLYNFIADYDKKWQKND